MKIMFIGCGNMGKAIIEGLAQSEERSNTAIYVNDFFVAKAEEINQSLKLDGVATLEQAGEMDCLLLAVKPKDIAVVCEKLAALTHANQMVISIAAGVTLKTLRSLLPNVALCRAMPNLAATVGEASTSLCYEGADQKQEEFAHLLFSSCGRCFKVSESLFDAVVGLAGSGPAYLMLVMEALADGGVLMGLPREQAMAMAIQTVKGSALLLEKSGEHPAVIKDRVCSPGGTSIAGVKALEERGLRQALIEAVERSACKNKQMAEQD